MTTRQEAFDKSLAELKANFDSMSFDAKKENWRKFVVNTFIVQKSKDYEPLGFSQAQIQAMAEKDAETLQSRLTAEELAADVDALAKTSYEQLKGQLEHERDNPGAADKPREISKDEMNVLQGIIMKLLHGTIAANFEGAKRESGEGAKLLRATLGISVADIEKYGLLGGENSFLRQIAPKWDDGGGLLGGEGSFFRKNLGLPW